MNLTTLLDLAGLLFLAAAVTVLAYTLAGLSLALFTAGCALLAVSWIVDALSRKGHRK